MRILAASFAIFLVAALAFVGPGAVADEPMIARTLRFSDVKSTN